MKEDFVERITPGKKFQNVVLQEHFQRYRFVRDYIKNKNVLDAGCGIGYGSAFLSRNGAKSVTGLDRSKTAISFAKNNYKNLNLKFEVGKVEKTHFKSNSFDVIVALEILEHLPNPMDFLKECQRILKPNGSLVVSTPNKTNSLITSTFNPFHDHEYFLSEFKQFLKPFFKSVKFYGQNFQEGKKSVRISKENELVEMPLHMDNFNLDNFYSVKQIKNDTGNYFFGICKTPTRLTKNKIFELKNQVELEHFKQLSRNLEKTALNKSSDPLSFLLGIYYLRRDLQESFPEVRKGNYDRLMQWASNTSKGITKDYLESEIKKFSKWYQQKGLVEESQENEIKDYRQKLDVSNNELKDYRQKLDVSNNELKDYRQKLDVSNNELKDYRQKLDVSNNELKDYRQKLDVSNNELKDYRQKLDVSNNELKDYRQKLDVSNNELKDYRQKLDVSNNELKDYRQKLDVSNNELKDYRQKLDVSNNELKDYRQKLDVSNNELKDYRQKLNVSNNELKDYRQKLNVSNNELKDYRQKLNVSNNELKEFESDYKLIEKHSKHLDQLLDDRQKELEDYKEKLNFQNNELKNHKEQVNSLSNELAYKKIELETIKKSYVMKMLKKIDNAFPHGTRKGDLKKIVIQSLGIISDEGFKNYLSQTKTKIQRKEFHVIDSIPESLNYFPEIPLTPIKEECNKFTYKPKISVLMPTYKTKLEWLDSAIQSLKSQAYENWELCICDDYSQSNELKERLNFYSKQDKRIKITWSKSNNGISIATNNALSLATGDFILFLDHDDEISPDAMFEIIKVLNEDKSLDFIYSDEDKIDDVGNLVEPFYKPDFSIHLLRSLNYLIHVAVIRRDLVKKVGGLNKKFDGAQDYDLFLRVLEKTNKIHHIKKILYHWRKISGSGAKDALSKSYIYERANLALQKHLDRCGMSAKSSIGNGWGLYKVKFEIKDKPNVDILIPTRKITFLKKCVKSIKANTSWPNYRIWALVNGKKDYEVIEIKNENCSELESISDPETGLIGPSLAYNWSRMNNIGVAKTNYPFLVFLNDDTEIISKDWIENMLQYAQLPEIGVVGVMLLYPNNTIQHAGDFITPQGTGDHCFNGMKQESFEINGFAQAVRETSAVTSACYMMRREVFEKLNGYDEKLRNYDDYDFCLRLHENNYSIIYTPYTKIYHHESPTRPQINDESMLQALLEKHPWARSDPFYRYEWINMYNRLISIRN